MEAPKLNTIGQGLEPMLHPGGDWDNRRGFIGNAFPISPKDDLPKHQQGIVVVWMDMLGDDGALEGKDYLLGPETRGL